MRESPFFLIRGDAGALVSPAANLSVLPQMGHVGYTARGNRLIQFSGDRRYSVFLRMTRT